MSGPGRPRRPVRRGPKAGPRPGRPKGRELPALATFTIRALRPVETRIDSAFPTLRGGRSFKPRALWVRKVPSVLGEWFRRVRVLIGEDLWDLLHGAEDRGVLSHSEALDIARADVIVECREREGPDRWVVVEVSWTVSRADVQRARGRADLLSRLGVPTVAIDPTPGPILLFALQLQ